MGRIMRDGRVVCISADIRVVRFTASRVRDARIELATTNNLSGARQKIER